MGELKSNQGAELAGWHDAQEAVIGSMLIDARCCGAVFRRASEEMFPDGAFRTIFNAIRGLWAERKPVDIVTVQAALPGNYDQLIADAMERTPTANNVEAYLDVLERCVQLSAYRAAAYEILSAPTLEACAAVWDRLGRELMGARKVRSVTLTDAISAYLDRMNDPAPTDWISLGIERLDKLLHIGRGKFVILAADSSAGKTALALQFAYHIADCGKKVGFFSLETDNDTLTDRLMAETQVAGIALPRTKAKALSSADYKKAIDAGDHSANVNLRLIDSVETVDGIRAETIARGFDVIVVDYLQLIDEQGEKRWDTVTQISMKLHRMAQALGVTVIGLSQVTPPDKSGNKRLTMDDLRESRQLKHDADVILLLELCDDYPNGRSLTVAKNKDGKRNHGMKLDFDPEHMTFSYHKPLPKSSVPEPPQLKELDDDEGGDLPF